MTKAAAFVSGAMTVRGVQFVLFSSVFGAIVSAEGKDVFDLIPATLLLLTGLLLIITAVRLGWWHKDDDPDAPPRKWMTALGRVSASGAFGMGAVMMVVALKHWVFTLSAIAIIDDGELSGIGSVLSYLFFVIGAHSLMLAPIISTAVAPAPSAKILEIMLRWLERNKRVITIVVSLVFGAWFISRGLTSYMAHGDTALTPLHTTQGRGQSVRMYYGAGTTKELRRQIVLKNGRGGRSFCGIPTPFVDCLSAAQ